MADGAKSSETHKGPSSSTTPGKKRLGRGLASLISSSVATDQDSAAPPQYVSEEPRPTAAPAGPEAAPVSSAGQGTPLEIPVAAIVPNPHQPRRDFNEAELEDLTSSVRQQGILQPLIVAADGEDRYVLVAGERRLRAAKAAGLESVPCVLRTATPQQMLEWALIENIQRADLNPVERAEAYRDYMDRFNLTQAQVGETLGQSRAAVANHLRMLDLPNEVQAMLVAGLLTFGHAKVLAGLAGQANRQIKLSKKILDKSLSVRQLENLVAAPPETLAAEGSASVKTRNKVPFIADLERQLTETIGTRVAIKPAGKKNSGKIVIEYYSLDDFDRIATALGAEIRS